MKYKVEVTIYNSYEIEAESQEEAEQLARELDCHVNFLEKMEI